MRVSFWSAFSQPAMYEVDSVSVAASMPQCPQRNAAPISAYAEFGISRVMPHAGLCRTPQASPSVESNQCSA